MCIRCYLLSSSSYSSSAACRSFIAAQTDALNCTQIHQYHRKAHNKRDPPKSTPTPASSPTLSAAPTMPDQAPRSTLSSYSTTTHQPKPKIISKTRRSQTQRNASSSPSSRSSPTLHTPTAHPPPIWTTRDVHRTGLSRRGRLTMCRWSCH